MTLMDHDLGTPRPRTTSRDQVLQTVELTIDGQTISVEEGTSVMRAAALCGVDVPKLCATESLDPFGSCRLCLVEIDGRKGTPASCTTPVTPGMSVKTQSPKLERLRRGVMVAGTDPARQTDLLRSSYSALLVIFRAVLRLHGVTPERDATRVIQEVATHCAFDPAPFLSVAALVRGTALSNGEAETVLAGYLRGMDLLVEYLDRFTPPTAAAAVISPVPS